ncbi:MAG: BNR-4 repeat-containing protein [Phycisphaerae bacterium]|nr:BNR-4 repeat-containing protein [Phycisphaerae bacterium]
MIVRFVICGLILASKVLGADAPAAEEKLNPPGLNTRADGYHGIWYANQKSDDEYKYKYSGGLGTYCAKHIPLAYYSEKAQKTFFCYGGTVPGKQQLLEMVSFYDHKTGMVPRPTLLMDKGTSDAHDNPTIMLDDDGYVWVFASSHGTGRPSFIFRSDKPYSTDSFTCLVKTNFSYPQPWHWPGKGFFFMHTRYSPERGMFWMTSPDGINWSEGFPLAYIGRGHYQTSGRGKDKIGSAFNYHPTEGGLNARTNLYYVETKDYGKTWTNVQGETLDLPLKAIKNPALVKDYEADKRLVYMKDINFDAENRPVILHLTSNGYASGPENNPRTWTTAQWTGTEWTIRPVTNSDNNYDSGSLYIEADGTWRILASTEPGPQRYNTGGEIACWVSADQGQNWKKTADVTRDSKLNHSYVRRPVNAHPDFYGFWADGHGREPSESRLYFCDKTGTRVFRLPEKMTDDFAKPEPLE